MGRSGFLRPREKTSLTIAKEVADVTVLHDILFTFDA